MLTDWYANSDFSHLASNDINLELGNEFEWYKNLFTE